jgi:hypothetical protein
MKDMLKLLSDIIAKADKLDEETKKEIIQECGEILYMKEEEKAMKQRIKEREIQVKQRIELELNQSPQENLFSKVKKEMNEINNYPIATYCPNKKEELCDEILDYCREYGIELNEIFETLYAKPIKELKKQLKSIKKKFSDTIGLRLVDVPVGEKENTINLILEHYNDHSLYSFNELDKLTFEEVQKLWFELTREKEPGIKEVENVPKNKQSKYKNDLINKILQKQIENGLPLKDQPERKRELKKHGIDILKTILEEAEAA